MCVRALTPGHIKSPGVGGKGGSWVLCSPLPALPAHTQALAQLDPPCLDPPGPVPGDTLHTQVPSPGSGKASWHQVQPHLTPGIVWRFHHSPTQGTKGTCCPPEAHSVVDSSGVLLGRQQTRF